jgi:hypothetical protein
MRKRLGAPALLAGLILAWAVGASAAHADLVLAEYHVWHGMTSHSQAFSDPDCFPDKRAYDSQDRNVIGRHIDNARSMGIDAFVVDWYGPPAGLANDEDRQFMDEATATLFRVAEAKGFRVAILYDEGALFASKLPSREYEARAIADLRYAERYFDSPAYLYLANRPALFVFPYPVVDRELRWDVIRNNLTRPATLLDQDPNPDAGDHDDHFDGFYAWVQASGGQWDPQGCEWGEAYLRWFYATMRSERYAGKVMVGGVWPGFDDRLAPWTGNRFISRRQGATWRDTWRLADEHGAGIVMIATWNDFEEGTDIEYGIGMDVKMDDPTPEVLMRSSPFTVNWAGGPRQLQVYHDCLADPIYNQLRAPGTVLTLASGEAYELKIWSGSDYLSKIVKVRSQDPSGSCPDGTR